MGRIFNVFLACGFLDEQETTGENLVEVSRLFSECSRYNTVPTSTRVPDRGRKITFYRRGMMSLMRMSHASA